MNQLNPTPESEAEKYHPGKPCTGACSHYVAVIPGTCKSCLTKWAEEGGSGLWPTDCEHGVPNPAPQPEAQKINTETEIALLLEEAYKLGEHQIRDGCLVPLVEKANALIAQPGAQQLRELNGRYGFNTDSGRLCVCGHRLGIHSADNDTGKNPCFDEDTGIEGATGSDCRCPHFKLSKKNPAQPAPLAQDGAQVEGVVYAISHNCSQHSQSKSACTEGMTEEAGIAAIKALIATATREAYERGQADERTAIKDLPAMQNKPVFGPQNEAGHVSLDDYIDAACNELRAEILQRLAERGNNGRGGK